MFKRKHRLAKESEVKMTFAKGRSFFSPNFLLKYYKELDKEAKFTIVVSTKVSKRAVVRNRLKRIVREVIKNNLASFKGGKYVVTIKPSALRLGVEDSDNLQKDFLDFIKRIKLI